MNEKHMQYVLTVLKEGSFTNAAKKLYVSQPSLSQIIKTAESNLGAPIFDRSTDPITLTPAGQLYVEAARQVTTISTNLRKQVEELSKEEFGTICLGISVQRGMELLPELYPRFKKRFPHVGLELHEQGSATMEKSVLEGEVGIALLTTSPRHEELVYDLIQEEQLVLIVNHECELAKRIAPGTPIDILEARDETFQPVRSLRPDDPGLPLYHEGHEAEDRPCHDQHRGRKTCRCGKSCRDGLSGFLCRD